MGQRHLASIFPLTGASCRYLHYYVAFHKLAIFVLKFQDFRYHGNRGWYFTVTFIYTDPENRLLFVSMRIIFLMQGKVAYNQFYTEIHKFSLPWQQGSV